MPRCNSQQVGVEADGARPPGAALNRATLTRAASFAKVAELADAPDLGSGSRKAMGVRVPPFALEIARMELSADYADYTDYRNHGSGVGC